MLNIISGKINFLLRLKRGPTFNKNFHTLNRICTFFGKKSHRKYGEFLKTLSSPVKERSLVLNGNFVVLWNFLKIFLKTSSSPVKEWSLILTGNFVVLWNFSKIFLKTLSSPVKERSLVLTGNFVVLWNFLKIFLKILIHDEGLVRPK